MIPLSKSEHRIQDEIRLGVCEQTPFLCFRCNAGSAWGGTFCTTLEDVKTDKGFIPKGSKILMKPRKIALMPEGFSDLLCFGPNATAVFIEVKDDTGKTREAQDRFLAVMQRMGFKAGVARSVEDAIKIIEGDCNQ